MKRFARSLVGTVAGSLLVASGCLLSTPAVSRPAEHIGLPDWNKTPVEDRDLGHDLSARAVAHPHPDLLTFMQLA